jgi:hypothetical protein
VRTTSKIHRTVLRGSVGKIENQVCCEVEFEDGSVCDSIPAADFIVSDRFK